MNDPARTTTLAELRSHIWNLADAICAELTILHRATLDKHAADRLATYAASLVRRADEHAAEQSAQLGQTHCPPHCPPIKPQPD